MDPLICWQELCELAEAGNLADAAEKAEQLRGWHLRGGFKPKEIPEDVWHGLRDFARLCRGMAKRNKTGNLFA